MLNANGSIRIWRKRTFVQSRTDSGTVLIRTTPHRAGEVNVSIHREHSTSFYFTLRKFDGILETEFHLTVRMAVDVQTSVRSI